MTHLYLIRHGEAMSAVKGFIGDGGLSPLGVLQAERLRDRLLATREIVPDVFIASTYPRAQQTAQIIAPAFDVPLHYDESIQELRPGEAEGMTLPEFEKKYGNVDFERSPFHALAPGAESWAQFTYRVGEALDRITREHEGKTIVLVCHGGVIDGSFLYFFKMSAWTPPAGHFYTRNTSITHWQYGKTMRGRQSWRLIKYNDVFHLHDIGSEQRIPWDDIRALPASDRDRPSVPVVSEDEGVDE